MATLATTSGRIGRFRIVRPDCTQRILAVAFHRQADDEAEALGAELLRQALGSNARRGKWVEQEEQ
jgi:hypothetical protein